MEGIDDSERRIIMNNLKEKEKTEINIDLDIDVEIEIPEDVELILWNSDYVPFEVVAAALLNIVGVDIHRSLQITAMAHQNGKAVIGLYPKEIAQTYADDIMAFSANVGFPDLKITVE